MHRSLFPAVLLSLGFVMIALAKAMPLFEWHVDEIAADVPPTYKVHIAPSPWKAQVGDSLNYGSYVSFGKIYISKGGEACRYTDLKLIIRRSQVDERLDQLSLVADNILLGIIQLNWTGIIVCVIYIWVSTVWHKRPFGEAIIFTVVAALIYYEATQIARALIPRIGQTVGILECQRAIVSLNAKLSKVHYETLIVSFTAILAELAAFGIMLPPIVRSMMKRKQTSNG